MPRVDRFKLLHGPYQTPKCRKGSRLFCEVLGTVVVGTFSDGPIMWPKMKREGRGRSPFILCGDLVKAVKCESSLAVAHHFGVSTATVKGWRRTLGVPRSNEGSRRLWGRVANARDDDRLERARRNSKRPAALAKASATLKGRIIPQHVIAAVRTAAKRPRSVGWRRQMSEYWRKRGHPPGHPELEFWRPEEDALLGTDSDANIARRLKRSYQGVVGRRRKLGIPPFLIEIDGKKLRRLRKVKGLTQHELSAKAQAYRDAVVNMELGRRARLRRDIAQRIAKVLGCEQKRIE